MSVSSNNDTEIITFKSNSTFICNRYGSMSINEDRKVLSFGLNKNGSLGHEEIDEIINPPKQIPNLNEIKMIDCGYNHTTCIDYDGNLFTFGSNECGQLVFGKAENELPFTHIPQQITNIPPIDSVSCGSDFTICITNDRNAYSFGENCNGQLGIGNNELCISPQFINDLNDIEFIECRARFVICKTYSNEYYAWGYNKYCQLGQGNIESCNKPIKLSNWPEDIIDIKCGSDHILLLTSKGYLYLLGNNKYGQIGLNDNNIKSINIPTLITDIPLIKRIECGYNHSMFIDINNKLWVFGYNAKGQLGLGDSENRYKPTLNESLHDIIDISSRSNHTFVKTVNNEIYSCGYNIFSQIGIKTSYRYQLTPIRVFEDKEDIWGSNIRRSKQKSARK